MPPKMTPKSSQIGAGGLPEAMPKIAQKTVKVLPTDNIISLKKRIQFVEHQFWIETLQKISQKEIDLDDVGIEEESFQV